MIIVQRSSEIKLMELLGVIRDPAGWQAVHFHLDALLDDYKSEYQFKIAINLIYDLLKGYEGGIYHLIDGSLAVVCNEIDKNIIAKLIFQLRYLYMDDPLSYLEDGSENKDFCTVYDLRTEWQDFMDMCGSRMAFRVRKSNVPEKIDREISGVSEQKIKNNFNLSRLVGIERDLEHADIQRVLRRQPVCVVLPDMSMRRVFDENYVHILHLRQLLKLDVDIISNRWLFKYCTQILDTRMLKLISQNLSRYIDSPISLNLNVETLVSRKFSEFDALIKPSSKVSIVIEVPVIDVFTDVHAFHVARRDTQKLGYRICLDGVSMESFLMIDRAKLGVDLVKIQWNADVELDLNSKENKEIIKAVSSFGSNRVILCRCDTKESIQYGQALGISLFQGRYIDSIISPDAKIEN